MCVRAGEREKKKEEKRREMRRQEDPEEKWRGLDKVQSFWEVLQKANIVDGHSGQVFSNMSGAELLRSEL